MKRRRVDGRSRGRVGADWCTPTCSGEYNPVAEARESRVASRGESSRGKHARMTRDFEEFSRARGVDPLVVTPEFDSHLANFYRCRLGQFQLREATAKAISAAMTDYFGGLGRDGPWQTGRDAAGNAFCSGHPNRSQAVADVKRQHLKALAASGSITVPVDPLEIGHVAAYFETHLDGSGAVDTIKLADYCLAVMAMNLMLRFDEVSKIREHVRRSRDQLGSLTFVVDIREKTEGKVRGQRYRLESWPGLGGDPRVDPVLSLGTYLLVRGEEPGFLFAAMRRERSGNLFMDVSKRMDADAFLCRFRTDLCEAGVDAAEWIGTHSFKRGGVQLLRQLGVDDCTIKARGRWVTMAAYWAYVSDNNRQEKRFAYVSPVAALVDAIAQGGAAPGT
ncbi:hypothetical protein I4F81_012846 [Pyropia yezoensis]|uniref:Uncharacterized protein n=1 Tax=Pyropia yezoensis TaxID=2788 RepID=A0ACC3CK91_PYRYE|nr:hypothetical protein I4F81_012846 [Neopyropia yezoensis]|eukprot:contig_16201_g3912